MDNHVLSIQADFITSYINNILNINILLITMGLFLIYWIQDKSSFKVKLFSRWDCLIYLAVLLGILAVILDLFIYKKLIEELTITGLNPQKPHIPRIVKHLHNLNFIFYLDLFILIFLGFGFFGKSYEKNKK